MYFSLVEIKPGRVALYKNLLPSSSLELIHSQKIKNNKNINRILTNSELIRYHDAIEYCIDRVGDLENLRYYTIGNFSSIEVSIIQAICLKRFGIRVFEINQKKESQIITNYLKNRKIYFWFNKDIIKIGYSLSDRSRYYQTFFRFSNDNELAKFNIIRELLLYNLKNKIDTVIYYIDPEVQEIEPINKHIELLGIYFGTANLLQGDNNFPTMYYKYLNSS